MATIHPYGGDSPTKSAPECLHTLILGVIERLGNTVQNAPLMQYLS